MAKQKNLSPLELKYLKSYVDNPTVSLQELSVEMGFDIEVLSKYIEALGGTVDQKKPETTNTDLTPAQIMVRESFATKSGAIMMTEGTAGMIEAVQGDRSMNNSDSLKPKSTNKKYESSIFRGNKPINPKANPYDQRRI